jgi:hypothetical protein
MNIRKLRVPDRTNGNRRLSIGILVCQNKKDGLGKVILV